MADTDTILDEDGKPKHPKRIHIDQLTAEQRAELKGRPADAVARLSHHENADGSMQTDIYVGMHRNGYTAVAASIDHGTKDTYFEKSIYFGVKQSALDATAKAGVHQMALDLAKQFKANDDLDIVLVGHSSKTAYSTVDAKTGKVSNNQTLSEDRAQAVNAQLIEEIKKINPALLSRIHHTSEGVGDNDLAVDTATEEARNRSVDIRAVSRKQFTLERSYRVVHLDGTDYDRLQKMAPNSNQFQVDFGIKTEVGKGLSENYSMEVAVAARGSLVLETLDMEKPMRITASVATPNDFRLIVPAGSGHVTYARMNADTVSVTADGREIALLKYDSPVKLRDEDIIVSSVDMRGDTTRLAGMSAAESAYARLAAKIDTNGDRSISSEELKSYVGTLPEKDKREEMLKLLDREAFTTKAGGMPVMDFVEAAMGAPRPSTSTVIDKTPSKGRSD